MTMKIFLLTISLAATLFTASQLWAKTADLGFRIGKAVAAEISTLPVEIIGKEQFPYPVPAKAAYAVAVLKLTQNRSLSSLDYSLVVNGQTVPCIAIVCNMAAFVCNPETTYPSEKDYARLLFLIDTAKVRLPAAGKTIRCTLKSNLRGRSSVTLNFVNLGNKPFTDCTKIPAAGILK